MCGLYVFQIIDDCVVDDPLYVAGGMAPLRKGSSRVPSCNGMWLDLLKKKNIVASIFP